jgi:hypothetical protein
VEKAELDLIHPGQGPTADRQHYNLSSVKRQLIVWLYNYQLAKEHCVSGLRKPTYLLICDKSDVKTDKQKNL